MSLALYFVKLRHFWFPFTSTSGFSLFSAGQKVIGEPVVSGLVLNDSGLWDPDFITAAKQVSYLAQQLCLLI